MRSSQVFQKKTTGIEDYEKLEKNYNNINF